MKFQSRYSPGKIISIYQYIVEYVCENNTKKADRNSELPIKFWHLKEWQDFFVAQMRFCSILCKKHDPEKILEFVKEKRIYNLAAKWIDQAIVEYEFVKKEVRTEEKRSREIKNPLGRSKKSSIFNKLRNIENGKSDSNPK